MVRQILVPLAVTLAVASGCGPSPGEGVAADGRRRPPRTIPPGTPEPTRRSGEVYVQPDDPDELLLAKAGKKVSFVAQVCFWSDGTVARVERLRSTGFPAYDGKIATAIRGWRYSPLLIEGRAERWCKRIEMNYTPTVVKAPTAAPGNRPTPAAPDSLPPLTVPPKSLEALRVSGEREILPDAADREAIEASRKRAVIFVKLCVAEDGSVESATPMSKSGYPGYDAKALAAIKTWRYRPVVLNGQPTRACSSIAIIYAPR